MYAFFLLLFLLPATVPCTSCKDYVLHTGIWRPCIYRAAWLSEQGFLDLKMSLKPSAASPEEEVTSINPPLDNHG